MGKIESNDNIFRLYAPFNLKIKKINQELFDDKTIINQSADTAWIAEFSTQDQSEYEELLSEE